MGGGIQRPIPQPLSTAPRKALLGAVRLNAVTYGWYWYAPYRT